MQNVLRKIKRFQLVQRNDNLY